MTCSRPVRGPSSTWKGQEKAEPEGLKVPSGLVSDTAVKSLAKTTGNPQVLEPRGYEEGSLSDLGLGEEPFHPCPTLHS